MENQIQEDKTEITNKNQTKEKLVRGVLLLSAAVVALVAVYTTILLFSSQEIDVSFSPPDAAKFELQQTEQPDESFDINIKDTGTFEKTNPEGKPSEEKEYKTQRIPPADAEFQPTINPLIIFEELAHPKNNLLIAVILIELVFIFVIYIRLDRKIKTKV